MYENAVHFVKDLTLEMNNGKEYLVE